MFYNNWIYVIRISTLIQYNKLKYINQRFNVGK